MVYQSNLWGFLLLDATEIQTDLNNIENLLAILTKMSKGIVAFRKGSIQHCQCHQIIVFVVKAQRLGNSRQDVFIL